MEKLFFTWLLIVSPTPLRVERIAAVMADGVMLARLPMPLPDNFHEVYQKWKAEKISTEEPTLLVDMSSPLLDAG